MTEANGGQKRLVVLAMIEYPDKQDETKTKTRWVKIGVGWPNRDGSINLRMDAFPIGTNKLQIREDEAPGARRNGSSTGLDPAEARP